MMRPSGSEAQKTGLIVYSLQAGGTERVAVLLASNFAEEGMDVSVYTLDNAKSVPAFPLHDAVRVVELGNERWKDVRGIGRIANVVKKYRLLRRRILEDGMNVVVSFTSEVNVLVLFALVGSGVPVIVSERSDPAVIPRARMWRMLRILSYRLLPARIVVQSRYAWSYFNDRGIDKVRLLPNPVQRPRSARSAIRSAESMVQVVCVGRLVKEKRYDLFIRAVRDCLDRNRNTVARFIVIGAGPEHDTLLSLSRRLGLGETIEFFGSCADPWESINKYDVYVQSSDVEGYPNALVEAMALGCAAIVSKYSPAVSELVDDGREGLLFDRGDSQDLSRCLERLLSDASLRRRIGDRAAQKVSVQSGENAGRRWGDLVKQFGGAPGV